MSKAQVNQVGNIFYAQSGGVTSVINASAAGLIETARQHPDRFPKIYAGKNGIIGALQEELIDVSQESDETISLLKSTPGGAFGSCRYKLKSIETHQQEYERLIEVFKAHNIRYFFYNGGGDSQDTAYKVSQLSEKMGYPIQCIGIPKTIDNDLPVTDNCPGFGSVAKYVAVSTREASLDIASMAASSTKVFVFEVMGRHAGWIAAAGGLAQEQEGDGPHLILMPEVAVDEELLYQKVQACVEKNGYCVIVVSEGIKTPSGEFFSAAGGKDAFGHQQLGGVAPALANKIGQKLGYKFHWAVADYLQRSARHISSAVDVEQAYAVGKHAVELALDGYSGVMPTIVRTSNAPYQWELGQVEISQVANVEKTMPLSFITEDGCGITDEARQYLRPLIMGEDYPEYENGLPKIARLKKVLVPQKLTPFKV